MLATSSLKKPFGAMNVSSEPGQTPGGRGGQTCAPLRRRLWEIGDMVKPVEDAEAAPRRRGPYKKKAA
jgi:hypothetical protein